MSDEPRKAEFRVVPDLSFEQDIRQRIERHVFDSLTRAGEAAKSAAEKVLEEELGWGVHAASLFGVRAIYAPLKSDGTAELNKEAQSIIDEVVRFKMRHIAESMARLK